MEKKKKEWLSKTPVVWFGAMICCFLWGSAFPGVKIGYEMFHIASDQTATQILFAGYRFTLAGVLVIVIGSILNRRLLLPKKESLGRVVQLSCLQTIAQYLFFYIGLANTTGVKASIIEGANVFIAILVASLLFHQEQLTRRKMIGSLIGFTGVLLINLTGSSLDMGVKFFGEGFILLSTVAYAFSSVFFKKYSKNENPIVLSGYQFAFGGIVMMTVGRVAGGNVEGFSAGGVLILFYLGMVSAVAYTLWGILLKHNPLSKVAVFGFMTPVFGVLLSAILLGESGQAFGLTSMVALFIVSTGIYIVTKE